MLENKAPSRLGSYIIIGVLLAILGYFIYETADYKAAHKWRGVEINMLEEKVEESKKVAMQYYMAALRYKQLFDTAIVMPKDGVISVKKGTIIIPPIPQEETPESQ